VKGCICSDPKSSVSKYQTMTSGWSRWSSALTAASLPGGMR
jgi:hypothetical protein